VTHDHILTILAVSDPKRSTRFCDMGRRLGLLLLLCTAAAAEDTQLCWSKDKRFSIEVPTSWVVERVPPGTFSLVVDAQVPGLSREVRISLARLEGPYLTSKAQAHYELETQRKRYKATVARYAPEPVPHIYLEHGKNRVTLLTFTRSKCRGLTCFFECRKADFPAVRMACLKAGASAKSTLGRFPPLRLDGYKRSEKDGFVYLIDEKVHKDGLRRVQKTLAYVQKRFAKYHGKIVRPADEPVLVYVHSSKSLAPIQAARTASRGNHSDIFGRRIFTVPLKKGDGPAERDLAHEAWYLFFTEYYGIDEPAWVRRGGSTWMWLEMKTGKKAPLVTESWFRDFTGVQLPLDALEPIRESDWDSYRSHAAAYVLFFRNGPSKYRKAYRTYLEHLLETGDIKDAFRHLRAFDQANLRDEVAAYVRKKLKVER